MWIFEVIKQDDHKNLEDSITIGKKNFGYCDEKASQKGWQKWLSNV